MRWQVWKNAGFASLRRVRGHIEHVEPRFDPTVFPLEATGSDHELGEEGEQGSEDDIKSLLQNSVATYRSLYLSGELTPLDVVQAILPLIRRDLSPPGEHSVAWFDVRVDQVLDAAKASTLRYQTKESLGPLDGVPTTVKDEYDIEGYVTSLGSVNDYTGQQSDNDSITSWCVVKLQEAGAIVMGKVSMHEFGLGNSLFISQVASSRH